MTVYSGAMFMAHAAYVKNGMLQQETILIRGLSQDGAEQAIAAYVDGLQSPTDLGKTITPVVMLPGDCTLIMPDESQRPPAAPKRGDDLLLRCMIERTAFNESRLVTVRVHCWDIPYQHLLDENRAPLARHLPVTDDEVIHGFMKVRCLRQESEHGMVELPDGCAFDCVEGELVTP